MIAAEPRPVAWLVIPGILTDAGDLNGWTDRAVTAINTLTPDKAQEEEYEAGALTRRFGHRERVRVIAKRAAFYQQRGFTVKLIVHSNGGFVAADLLAARGELVGDASYHEPIQSVHLFAPACDGWDIATALKQGDVRRVFVYGSANDRALRLGRITRALLGWIKIGGHPLGYGTLGLDASYLVAQFPGRARFIRRNDYGHSTWFEPENFDATIQLLLQNEASL